MFLRFLVVLLIFLTVQSAPVDDKATGTLIDIVSGDARANKLLSKRKIVDAECGKEQEMHETFCLTLYDIALKFDQQQLNFTNSKIEEDKDFCNKLFLVLPDEFNFDEATKAKIKHYPHSVKLLKDVFKRDEKKCNEQCMINIPDYDEQEHYTPRPLCFFIFNQYKFLASLQQPQLKEKKAELPTSVVEVIKNSTTADKNVKVDTKTTDNAGVQAIPKEIAEAIIPILPANLVAIDTTTKNKITQTAEPTQTPASDVKPKENVDKLITTPVANKTTEVTQAKPETIIPDEDAQGPKDVDVFGSETQSDFPEKTDDVDGNENDIGPDDEEEDDDFQTDLVRDNNRNVPNKFNNMQSTDIEAPDEVPHVRVQNMNFEEDPDSNFFTYLCAVMFVSILLYILYHNRHKILALLLEGRRGSRRQRERSRGGSKAAYSKLDCNLEEAITSKKSLSGKSMDIIY